MENRRVAWPDSKTGGMSQAHMRGLQRLDPCLEGSWGDERRHANGIRHSSATDIANSGIPVKVGMMLITNKTVVEAQRDKKVSV